MAADNNPSIIERFMSVIGYERRSADEFTLDQLFDKAGPFNLGRNRLTNQREQLKAYVDWVYAAASAIAQDAATVDLRAYANRSGKPNGKIAHNLIYNPRIARELQQKAIGNHRALEELDNHILLELFERPNPVQDADSFKEMTFLHMLLAGEAFWYKLPGTMGRPKELWPLMPYCMKEKVEDRVITKWTYRVGAVEVDFDPEELVHIKLTDPENLYRGTGVIKAAARSINTGRAASDWNESFFANSARPDLALETDSVLNPDVVERLREQWNDRYRGTDNAHKVAVLEAGLKVNKITATQREMDFLKSLEFNRDQQLAMFKTSRTMLGIIEGDGRANMESAEYNQAKRVIRPLDRRFVAAINHSLAPDYDPKLVIGFTDPVPEDKEFLHKTRIESVNVYRTINEVREEEGLEPVDGGDVIYLDQGKEPLGITPVASSDNSSGSDAATSEGKKGLPKPSSSTIPKKSVTR